LGVGGSSVEPPNSLEKNYVGRDYQENGNLVSHRVSRRRRAMYDSLYTTLNSLVRLRKSGTLNLQHENGTQGILILKQGCILGIETGNLKGEAAGQALSMWIAFSSEFHENIIVEREHCKGIDADNYLALLTKRAQQSDTLQKVVPFSNDCVFKLFCSNLKGKRTFKTDELTVALALDGKTSTKRIVLKTGLPDLQVLNYIYELSRIGLAKRIYAKKPLSEKKRDSLIMALTETLTEAVGPVAGAVLNDAFTHLESESQVIYESEVAQLIETISNDMEEDDRIAFVLWGLDYLKRL
jgi:hypothetical protein